MRVSCPGNQNDGGAHIRDTGSEPRRVVAVGGAGVAGNVAGDDLGGRRSSGEVELGLRDTARLVEWCYGFLRVR